MKNTLKFFLVIALIFNVMTSTIVTIVDICSNRYFKEYENIKSFENKKLYMTTDLLLIQRAYEDTGSENAINLFMIEGILASNSSKIRLTVGKQEYLGSNLDTRALYKSKLTNDYFLKDAPPAYYNDNFISFYSGIYFKVSFYIIIGIIIYMLAKYIKARRYRLY